MKSVSKIFSISISGFIRVADSLFESSAPDFTRPEDESGQMRERVC